VKGELSDFKKLVKSLQDFKAEAIMHFAANAQVGESMANPSKYFENNLGGGIQLLAASQKAGVKRFIHSSSCAAYGIPERVPITEEMQKKPISPYGQTKLMFEQILEWYDRIHGVTFANLRYFNAAGASSRFGEDHRVETHLIPNVLKAAMGLKPHVEIYGTDYSTPDGTCIRDYVHVLDLATAHMLALELTQSDSFNIGTGVGTSVQQVIDTARRITGREITAIIKPRREGDPDSLVASVSKVKRLMGWEAKFNRIDAIIESAWKWHEQFPDGYRE
jgi:UDP-glucose 4-epimerase